MFAFPMPLGLPVHSVVMPTAQLGSEISSVRLMPLHSGGLPPAAQVSLSSGLSSIQPSLSGPGNRKVQSSEITLMTAAGAALGAAVVCRCHRGKMPSRKSRVGNRRVALKALPESTEELLAQAKQLRLEAQILETEKAADIDVERRRLFERFVGSDTGLNAKQVTAVVKHVLGMTITKNQAYELVAFYDDDKDRLLGLQEFQYESFGNTLRHIIQEEETAKVERTTGGFRVGAEVMFVGPPRLMMNGEMLSAGERGVIIELVHEFTAVRVRWTSHNDFEFNVQHSTVASVGNLPVPAEALSSPVDPRSLDVCIVGALPYMIPLVAGLDRLVGLELTDMTHLVLFLLAFSMPALSGQSHLPRMLRFNLNQAFIISILVLGLSWGLQLTVGAIHMFEPVFSSEAANHLQSLEEDPVMMVGDSLSLFALFSVLSYAMTTSVFGQLPNGIPLLSREAMRNIDSPDCLPRLLVSSREGENAGD